MRGQRLTAINKKQRATQAICTAILAYREEGLDASDLHEALELLSPGVHAMAQQSRNEPSISDESLYCANCNEPIEVAYPSAETT